MCAAVCGLGRAECSISCSHSARCHLASDTTAITCGADGPSKIMSMLLLPMSASYVIPPLPHPAAYVRTVPTTSTLAFVQPEFLGKPAANRDNPGGAGNAEGNWWTPSNVDPKDTQAKVAEIKARQAISELNGQYKVEKLEKQDKQKAERAAKQAAKNAELQVRIMSIRSRDVFAACHVC